jgi:hypothetical protein
MLTDTLTTLRNDLADLGFPSVLDMDDSATIRDYYTTISDAWLASDQTDDDARACDAARIMIDYAFRA